MSIIKKVAKYIGLAFLGVILFLGIVVTVINVFPDLILGGLSQSHTSANVPSQEDFDSYLKRDLTAYFSDDLGSGVSVEYELLRNGPAQNGIGFPKYYIWVTAKSDGLVIEGVARIAAMEQGAFSVTDFVSSEEIKSNPDSLDQIFPKDLIQDIENRVN